MPPRSSKPAEKTVTTFVHDEASRRNIPTAEFEPLLRPEQQRPIRVAYERRNRDLDPQLIWRGKYPGDDMETEQPLSVNAPPLYIQEKVNPKVLIDDLKRETERQRRGAGKDTGAADLQTDLFADFNGLPSPDARTEFYQHEQHWSNRMILGDSLQVMASLAEREALRGKVQCIYFDPPYGIKFNSNFQWSTTSRDVKDGNVEHITREPEQVKAFRDTWRDGIHSYLSYIRDRLVVARDLLTESGSIFVQIGDENLHRVRAVMDEVFGDENFVSQVTIAKTGGQPGDGIPNVTDYIIWFAKNHEGVKLHSLYLDKIAGVGSGSGGRYTQLDENGKNFRLVTLTSARPPGDFPISFEGRDYRPVGRYWTTGRIGAERLKKAGRVIAGAKTINFKS